MTERTPEFLGQFPKGYGIRSEGRPDYARCAESIHGVGRWPSFHQCNRKNGHGPHGAWCKQHDPVARKAKQDARNAKWRAEYDDEHRKATFAEDCKAAIRQIAAGHNDPRGLAQSIIDKLDGKT